MKIHEARDLGDRLAGLVDNRQLEEAFNLLSPALAARTPFRLLDATGERLGNGPRDAVCLLLEQVAEQRTMGGWVVIASALRRQMPGNLPGALERCWKFIIYADVWYATDIFGERLPGPALWAYFEPSLRLLAPWREDPNRWVRRSVGVAVHYWAKQARGAAQYQPQVRALLEFLAPLFTETQADAVKGVGWGLKTLGKTYPELAAGWLAEQVGRPHRQLMLRKATTYLPVELRQRITGKIS
jgi:hypothetical protein